MQEYVDLLSGLPIPSVEQINNFANYVSGAHSWYKHLPTVPPGSSFFFYLDPGAGFSQILRRNGHIDFQERKGKGFHYSDLPTSEYRDRFGYLAYICLEGTTVSLNSNNGDSTVQPDKNFGIRTTLGQLVQLPVEIIRTGQSFITAAVYNASNIHILIFRMQLERENEIKRNTWQAMDAGSIAVDKILNRVDRLNEERLATNNESQPETYKLGSMDSELAELLTEERRRQLALMTSAMKNVIALIEDRRTGKLLT